MTDALPDPESADRRILLGAQLRRLREMADFTREDASSALKVSPAKVTRMELGHISFKERDVRALFVLYGGTDQDELARLVDLAHEGSEPGERQSYN